MKKINSGLFLAQFVGIVARMSSTAHITPLARNSGGLIVLDLLLLSSLWACPSARPLRGVQASNKTAKKTSGI